MPAENPTSRAYTLQLIATMVPLLALCFAIFQYSRQTSRNLEQEFQTALWLQKKDVFTNLCGVLGSIAVGSGNEDDFKQELKKFSALYYGSIRLIGDTSINNHVDDIMLTLRTDFDQESSEDMNILKQKIIRLNVLCRQSLENDLKD